jgi:hypothetical protein
METEALSTPFAIIAGSTLTELIVRNLSRLGADSFHE